MIDIKRDSDNGSDTNPQTPSEVDPTPEVDPIVPIYEGQCPSLSGRSTLTFAIGRHSDSRGLHLRIVRNSGGGMFCPDWIPAGAIEAIVSGGMELTSRSFQVLKPGRSTNTAGFVAAALKAMGYIRTNGENTRLHEHVPTETFEKAVMARIGGEAKPARRKAK